MSDNLIMDVTGGKNMLYFNPQENVIYLMKKSVKDTVMGSYCPFQAAYLEENKLKPGEMLLKRHPCSSLCPHASCKKSETNEDYEYTITCGGTPKTMNCELILEDQVKSKSAPAKLISL